MMHRGAHTMRLRSRANSQDAITRPEGYEDLSYSNHRSILGDISNKFEATGDKTSGNGDHKKVTRSKRSRELNTSTSIQPDEHGRINNRKPRNHPIRSSSRLNVKNAREDIEPRLCKRTKIESEPEESRRVRCRGTVNRIDEHETRINDGRIEVEPRNLEREFLIHPDYRLERSSFDGISHTLGIAPHDRDDEDDVLQVAPYVTDIFQHLFLAEEKSHPRKYMDSQTDINAKMRAILVDWLVEVHMKFRLVPETLYLCINIIDRYCNLVQIKRTKLQLVGVTALLIACKYEEIYPPEVRDCVYITDRAYQRQEVLDMEQDIVYRLDFKITVPTAYPFLQRFLNIVKASTLTRHAASYYMERTLQEHDMLYYRPSVLCASAIILALSNPDVRRREDSSASLGMPNLLLEFTGFKETEIIECAALIAKKVGEEPVTASKRQLVAVKRKYDNKKFLHVSTAVDRPSAKTIITTNENKFVES